MQTKDYMVTEGKDFKLSDIDPRDKGGLNKTETREMLMPANIAVLADLQEKLFVANDWAILVVIQAMDTAGKDGLIKHVMTGLNPQGTQVTSFKAPTSEDLDHDYLWRINKALPRRGNIGIFNRSHYEEVAIARVHDLVAKQQIPKELVTDEIWEQRYRQISGWEKYLFKNGIKVVKLFLHISPEEQRERLLDRIWRADKRWKFSAGDIEERQYWNEYQHAYELMLQKTSTKLNPWYVIPSDRKWFSRYLVSKILRETMEDLNLQLPVLSEQEEELMLRGRRILLNEPGALPYVPEHIRDAGREAEQAYLERFPKGAYEELLQADPNSVDVPFTAVKDLL